MLSRFSSCSSRLPLVYSGIYNYGYYDDNMISDYDPTRQKMKDFIDKIPGKEPGSLPFVFSTIGFLILHSRRRPRERGAGDIRCGDRNWTGEWEGMAAVPVLGQRCGEGREEQV